MRFTRLASSSASPLRSRSKTVKSIWPWINPVVCYAANAAPNLAEVSVDAQLRIVASTAGALLLHQALTLAGKRKIIGASEQRRADKTLRFWLGQDL
jgi:hypothetical protein